MLLYEEQTKRIVKACLDVHNELGNGFLEQVYQEALEMEFKNSNIPYEREKLLPIYYKGKRLNKDYYAEPHRAQVLNYLYAAEKHIGILVNFGSTSLKWERISNFHDKEFT